MLNHKKTTLPNNTYQFDLVIEKETIQKTYHLAFTQLAQEVELPGFRKGKAPLEIAQKEIKKEVIYDRVLKKILPELYENLLRKENLKPIVTPKIELVKAQEGENWEVRVTIAEKPAVDLKSYRELIKNALAETKKANIWTPGQSPEPKAAAESKDEQRQKRLQIVFEALLKNIKVSISELLIEPELDKRLTQLLDDVRRIGLTMEAYLKSKNETVDAIKERFRKEIEEMYRLEFILEAVAETEKIVVDDKDLESFFANIKEEKARETARRNAYFYATLLRRQKTLDYLMGL